MAFFSERVFDWVIAFVFFCQLITYFCCVSFWVKNRIVPVFFCRSVAVLPSFVVFWTDILYGDRIFTKKIGFLFFFYWKRSTVVTEFYFRDIFLLRFCWCCRVTFHYVRLVDLRNYRQLSNGLGLNSSVEPCSSFILFLSSYYWKISKRGLKKKWFHYRMASGGWILSDWSLRKKKRIFFFKKKPELNRLEAADLKMTS